MATRAASFFAMVPPDTPSSVAPSQSLGSANRGEDAGAVVPGDDVRVRGDETGPDDPAGALRADSACRPLELDDRFGGGSGARAFEHARVRRRQPLLQPWKKRKRVEAVERLQDPVGRHRAQEPRQDRGASDLGPQPQRGLVEGEHRQEPGDRERDQPAECDSADPVERAERRMGCEEGPHRLAQRPGGEAEDEGADECAQQAGEGKPGRVLGEEMRGDDRAENGAQREPSQGECLGGEAPVRSENGEGRDPEQQENVDDVHPHRVRATELSLPGRC